jgi:hypothetical protein
MAREIKYFSGTVTNGTLYTVPVGRTAKVIINYFTSAFLNSPLFSIAGNTVCPKGGSGVTPESSVGQLTEIGLSSTLSFPVPATYLLGKDGSTGSYIMVQKEWYIGPGATVSSSGSSGGGQGTYSFMAIEEY